MSCGARCWKFFRSCLGARAGVSRDGVRNYADDVIGADYRIGIEGQSRVALNHSFVRSLLRAHKVLVKRENLPVGCDDDMIIAGLSRFAIQAATTLPRTVEFFPVMARAFKGRHYLASKRYRTRFILV